LITTLKSIKTPHTGQSVRVRPTNSFVEFNKEEINQSIPARFEQQVSKYPDRVAVKTARLQFTYLELNQFANRIARAILARSGRSAEPVGLLIQQGAPLIGAILGVLKAGKFYVPLDSSFPEIRLATMVEHSQPSLILTDNTNLLAAEKLSNGTRPVLTLDQIGACFSSDDLALAVSPEAIAYILYTSGSTGKPKGVFQCHRNVLHGIMKYTNGSHLCADDRLTLLMSASFGASVSDIFGALLNGAGLFPFNLKEEGMLHLKDWLIDEEITVYHSVPTVFRHFVATLNGTERFPKLRLVKLGGESVHRKDFEEFKRYFPPGCLFQVGFGATEINSICQYFCDHWSTFEGATAPVGYAMDHTEILLLDGNGQQVKPGDTGEIAIRSRYLALGYWRQPELTKKAFRSDHKDEARTYCTGDLGRLLPDGCLVHLGRKDFQLKIRGHRVDAAEVEMALRENASVKETVVVERRARNGEPQLVAYIVPRGGPVPSISGLRASLRQSLPDYMIPSAFVVLDALPLTDNGKVDRNELPPPAQERPNLGTEFIAPRDTVEFELARIWSGILGIESIGALDNFFSLGGDSLSSVQLISQVTCSFQVELAMQTLIESPTIAGLAEQVRMLKRRSHSVSEAPWTSLVSIQGGNSRQPFFLIPGGGGSYMEFLIYGRMAQYLGREFPCYGLRARASDRKQQPHACTEEMATDYIREMRAIQPNGPYLLVGECVGGIVAYEMAQQLLAQGQQVALLALLDTSRPTRARQFAFWWRQLRDRGLVSWGRLPRRIVHHWRHQPADRGLGERMGHLLGKSRSFAQKIASVSYLKQAPPKDEELKEMWHDEVLRTGYVRTLYRYRPRRYPGRITMLVNEVDARRHPDFGWRRLAAGGLTIYTVPGDHYSYIRDHARHTAERLRDCLEKATTEK